MEVDVNRRDFLSWAGMMLACAGLGREASAGAEEVAWLGDVQHVPEGLGQPASLRPLLVREDGSEIRTLAEWEARRAELRALWMEFLGEMPGRPAADFETVSETRVDGCRRVRVRYTCEPGMVVEGYVLYPYPLADAPRPGIVAFHSTTPETIDEVAGVSGRDSRALGLKFARAGYVVFCPKCFLWHEDVDYTEAARRFQARHPGALGMRKMLYDAQLAVDVLASLPEVDAGRIGAVGHSLGAKEALYLAAFDERVKAAVASEGGIGLGFTNWHDPWYLGSAIHDPGFARDHHELLALIAPRAFLILAGESGPPTMSVADGDRTWPYVEAALPVYALYGGPARIGLYNHRQGHTIPEEAFVRMREWMAAYLGAGR